MNFPFLLSAVEFAMPDCYLTLDQILKEELPHINGIVMYSMLMLPSNKKKRLPIYDRFLETKTSLHGALEQLTIKCRADIDDFENILLIDQALNLAPRKIRLT